MSDNLDMEYNWYNLESNFRIYLRAVKKIQDVSIKNYLSDIRYFFGWIYSLNLTNLAPEAVMTPAQLDAYRSLLIESKLPPKTVNRRLSSLRSLCEFMLTQNIIASDPSKHIRNHSSESSSKTNPLLLESFLESKRHEGLAQSELMKYQNDIEEFIHFTQQA